jgi:hypothetical protein
MNYNELSRLRFLEGMSFVAPFDADEEYVCIGQLVGERNGSIPTLRRRNSKQWFTRVSIN